MLPTNNKNNLNINTGEAEFRATPGAMLIDVREPDEYRAGHLAGSVNLPLGSINCVGTIVPDFDTPLFVYCRSGGRSSRAVEALRALGYKNVQNIGGIIDYTGSLVRGEAVASR